MNAADLLRDALKREHARQLELCPASDRVQLARDQAFQRVHLGSCIDQLASSALTHPLERAALFAAVFALAGVDQ